MFTGLIEAIGTLVGIQPVKNGKSLEINSPVIIDELTVGDSVAVNGVCLTITQIQGVCFKVEALSETLAKSTFDSLKSGSKLNLERAVRFGDRMGGHFVQGHVDGLGEVDQKYRDGSTIWLDIKTPRDFDRYIVSKGSIAIDGISLTVAQKREGHVKISIISHTYENSNLQFRNQGDSVNIELDMMAKYIENMLTVQQSGQKSKITEEWLKEQGFT